MRRRLVVRRARWGLALTTATVSLASAPAAALSGIQASGSVSDGQIQATASAARPGSGASDPRSAPYGGSSDPPPPCSYVPADPSVAAAMGPGGPGPGTWYFTNCEFSGLYASPYPPIWVPAGAAPGSAPSVPTLIQQAKGQATLATPSVQLNPPGDQIVNYRSWLWVPRVEWSVVTASATAGGVTATVTAAPEKVVFSMGDGDSVTCDGPGVTYDSSKPADQQSTYCSYIWRTSSASEPGEEYRVTATIYYAVTTAVHGAANPTPNLGIVASPAGEMPVRVAEVETLGTGA